MDMPDTELHSEMAHATARAPVRLSRRRQLILLVFVTALVGAGVFLGPRALRKPEEAAAPAASDATTNG